MIRSPSPISWSHLTLGAYEYFLLCDLCGAMIHDSPTSQRTHEKWHVEIEDQLLCPLHVVQPSTTA